VCVYIGALECHEPTKSKRGSRNTFALPVRALPHHPPLKTPCREKDIQKKTQITHTHTHTQSMQEPFAEETFFTSIFFWQEPLRSSCAARLGAQGAGKIVRRLREFFYFCFYFIIFASSVGGEQGRSHGPTPQTNREREREKSRSLLLLLHLAVVLHTHILTLSLSLHTHTQVTAPAAAAPCSRFPVSFHSYTSSTQTPTRKPQPFSFQNDLSLRCLSLPVERVK
jgi:hypothetical protein